MNALRRTLATTAAVCGICMMSLGAWLLALELHTADQLADIGRQLEQQEVRP